MDRMVVEQCLIQAQNRTMAIDIRKRTILKTLHTRIRELGTIDEGIIDNKLETPEIYYKYTGI